jgi:hypothetical protein
VDDESDLAADQFAILARLERPPAVAAVDEEPWRGEAQASLEIDIQIRQRIVHTLT